MKGSEIRTKFLKYFESLDHKILPSSSLVPSDPTVLLTLAGMLQFKPIFLGEEKPKYKRVTTCQKCIRMVDIEHVGKTPRHHTFFEMLGNFSFGDYFKREAISWAWEFLTKELGLDKDRLSVAVFEKDDEAASIWTETIGVPKERVYRLGEDNNFWFAGPTGPCGPCSEIYWDMGSCFGCGRPDCMPGCDCDRFLELWNLVFIELNRDEKGKRGNLPSKGIDTGMGLERIASVLQGVSSNFETDLFKPIVSKVQKLIKVKEEKQLNLVNIISDHIRAITYLIADGTLPLNEGRGYVLRRLVRRAVRFGRMAKIDVPFLYNLSSVVVALGKDFYPELKQKAGYISKIIKSEEENFIVTLEQGLGLLSEIMAAHSSDKLIPGKEAFRLHDTCGFPLELISEIVAESRFSVDIKGFEQQMAAQRERARAAGMKKEKPYLDISKYSKFPATKFVGHDNLQVDTRILAVFPDEKIIILDKTPFYPEGGGQVGDKGSLSFAEGEVKVTDTLRTPGGVILHKVKDVGDLKPRKAVKATVDGGKRYSTANHHTATHLLHRALRIVLGEEVRQTGSYVAPDYFRFDYTHVGALKDDEIAEIEAIVNSKIKENIKVETFETALGEAQKLGAVALFGEKYGKKVRVIKIGDFSMELCGGTHVKNTGTIELFKIRSEGAVAAGVRRIEAVAGSKVIEYVLSSLEDVRRQNVDLICACKAEEFKKEQLGGAPLADFEVFEITSEEVNTIKSALRNKDLVAVDKFMSHLQERNERLKDRIESIRKETHKLSSKKIDEELPLLTSKAAEISGVRVVMATYKDIEKDVLRELCDKVIKVFPSCVMLFGSVIDGKPILVCAVTKELVEKGLNAATIVKAAARVVGGGGGGKAHLAEAGGKDASKLNEAMETALEMIKSKLEGVAH